VQYRFFLFWKSLQSPHIPLRAFLLLHHNFVCVCVCLSLFDCLSLYVSLSLCLSLFWRLFMAWKKQVRVWIMLTGLRWSYLFLPLFFLSFFTRSWAKLIHSVSLVFVITQFLSYSSLAAGCFFLEASERKLVTMIFIVLLASCNSFKPPCCREGLVLFLSPPVGKLSLLFLKQMSSSS